jgi:hypothetical protein
LQSFLFFFLSASLRYLLKSSCEGSELDLYDRWKFSGSRGSISSSFLESLADSVSSLLKAVLNLWYFVASSEISVIAAEHLLVDSDSVRLVWDEGESFY